MVESKQSLEISSVVEKISYYFFQGPGVFLSGALQSGRDKADLSPYQLGMSWEKEISINAAVCLIAGQTPAGQGLSAELS